MTPPAPTARETVHRLASTLKEEGLTSRPLESLFQQKASEPASRNRQASFWLAETGEAVRLLAFGHHEFSAHGLILDSAPETLGILHLVSPPGRPEAEAEGDSAAPAELKQAENELRDRLEQAAYVRHLLLQQRASDQALRPVFVEVALVLVDWDESAPLVGNVLRRIMETSSFLHTIGVGLLDGREAGSPSAVRRAFPWLLTACRKWYRETAALNAEKKGNPAAARLEKLTLNDFRRPGPREWNFAANETLHVVHGQNGSGKSTLTEALELMVTGRIQRLEKNPLPEGGYAQVLRYHPPGDGGGRPLSGQETTKTANGRRKLPDLQATLTKPRASADRAGTGEKRTEDAMESWTGRLEKDGIGNALAPDFPADAFRLDETLAIRISRGSAGERAAVFLESLLGEAGKAAQNRARAEYAAETLLGKLPRAARRARETRDVPPASRTGLRLEALGARMAALECFFPDSDASGKTPGGAWQTAWNALRGSGAARHQAWTEALAFLTRLSQWDAADTGAKTEVPREAGPLLRDFEELTALVDLLERESAVTATLARAMTPNERNEKWDPPEGVFCGLRERTREQAEHQRKCLAEALKKQEHCRERLERFQTGGSTGPAAEKPRLPAALAGTLDEVGQALKLKWDRTEWQELGFGQGIRRALEENTALRLRDSRDSLLSIGRRNPENWLTGRVRGVVEALEELSLSPEDYPQDLTEFGRQMAALEHAEDVLHRLEGETVRAFTGRISGPLADALNELTALMTPARWAYTDLTTRMEVTGDAHAVELNTGSVPAALTLNTAELNTMTLALFLLCGLQEKNPLRMIVLDDPLQNMDELSVTTVARGLARLLRLWEELHPAHGWRLVLLLHGEENVERIRAETPCAAYFLPWLTPGLPAPGTEPRVASEGSLLGTAITPVMEAIRPAGEKEEE